MVKYIKYIVWFIVLVVFQLLVLNNIQFSGYINPYLYIYLILILPFETPFIALFTVAFFLGFAIDIGNNTLGINAAATVFAASLRPFIINIFSPRTGYNTETYPRASYYGINWFVKYASLLVFMHHLFLFFVESFSFNNFFHTLLKVILSFIFTIILIIITELFFYKKQ